MPARASRASAHRCAGGQSIATNAVNLLQKFLGPQHPATLNAQGWVLKFQARAVRAAREARGWLTDTRPPPPTGRGAVQREALPRGAPDPGHVRAAVERHSRHRAQPPQGQGHARVGGACARCAVSDPPARAPARPSARKQCISTRHAAALITVGVFDLVLTLTSGAVRDRATTQALRAPAAAGLTIHTRSSDSPRACFRPVLAAVVVAGCCSLVGRLATKEAQPLSAAQSGSSSRRSGAGPSW